MKIGIGYDVHAFCEGRPLVLGGVTVPHHQGLLGHSDADVLLHAVMDALLGACALGDIGRHFPDTDPCYKGASSLKLLAHVWELIKDQGYRLGNLDSIIVAQKPKLSSYIVLMRENIAKTLATDIEKISVKATTTEHLGFEGREEGISAQAVVCLLPGEAI
jgi:2-C-methyl-D-erythritol 2,4-cyclodiphosphate synthase